MSEQARGIEIRPFRDEDAPAVSAIIERCFTRLDLGGHTSEGIRLQIAGSQPDSLITRSRTTRYFVAAIHGAIAGICGHGDGKVQTFFVDLDHHGKGVGKALLTTVLADAEQHGLTKIITWSTMYAEDLYASFGFEREREVHLPEGSREIVLLEMSKKLP